MKNLESNIIRVLTLLGLASFMALPQAHAIATCSKEVKILNSELITNLTYQSKSITKTENAYTSQLSGVADTGRRVISSLESELYKLVGDELKGAPYYRSHSVEVNGPLQMDIAGDGKSEVLGANFSMESILLRGDFKQSKKFLFISVSAECGVGITFKNPHLYGSYDIRGNNIQFGVSLLNHSKSVRCSSSFSWIPIIGDKVDGLLNRKTGILIDRVIEQKVSQSLKFSYKPGDFLGLYSAIPNGQYVANGTDIGKQFREELISFMTKFSLSVKLDEWNRPTIYSRNISDEPTTETQNLFDLKFYNGAASVSIAKRTTYLVSEASYCGRFRTAIR